MLKQINRLPGVISLVRERDRFVTPQKEINRQCGLMKNNEETLNNGYEARI